MPLKMMPKMPPKRFAPRPFILALGLCLALLPAWGAATAQSADAKVRAKVTAKTSVKHNRVHTHRTRIVVHPRVRRDPPGTLPGFGRGDVYDRRIVTRRYRGRPNAFAYTLPAFYDWDGARYYPGRPGFYRGQWNGGSFGPCYTQTPIGPINNCGQ
jgi:hypothetical protein